MSFTWSSLLYLLLLVPLLVWVYQRIQKRKRESAARLGSFGVLHDASGGASARRQLPAILFLIGITILILSLARPQAAISLPKIEGTVILTFDVSGSMSADDLKPNRMEAAKAAALDFVDNQPTSVKIGVVAFSDGGITVQNPTGERAEIIDTIERLVPRRGTSVGNGILVALNTIVVDAGDPAFLSPNAIPDISQPQSDTAPQSDILVEGWYPSSAIVLFSDGENNQEPDPVAAADLAVDLGVRIYTVGIGTVEGATITVEGFTVHSRLEEPMLEYISTTTGGAYYNAGNEEDLRRIYNDLEPKLTIKPEEMEVTSLFAGLGMALFIVGGALSLLWFGRVP
ncbi:MAG TPA: VWA domain-containing protein [Anaerolineales bacterium]|nr:VWA domain-containing protein [Anaerolineales bacterium]HNQ96185.1 VWA domain-containing protein [Anaerolineales bacterium]HNS62014.1 VWA domain-containing protein [Anaerolineales bacterium]